MSVLLNMILNTYKDKQIEQETVSTPVPVTVDPKMVLEAELKATKDAVARLETELRETIQGVKVYQEAIEAALREGLERASLGFVTETITLQKEIEQLKEENEALKKQLQESVPSQPIDSTPESVNQPVHRDKFSKKSRPGRRHGGLEELASMVTTGELRLR